MCRWWALIYDKRTTPHPKTNSNVLSIAGPVGLVCPVDSLVPHHQRIDGVTRIEDGQGASKLAVPDDIPHAPPTLEHIAILLPNAQPNLKQSSTTNDGAKNSRELFMERVGFVRGNPQQSLGQLHNRTPLSKLNVPGPSPGHSSAHGG